MITVALHGISNPDSIRAIRQVAGLWDIRIDERPSGNWAGFDGVISSPGAAGLQSAPLDRTRPFLAFTGTDTASAGAGRDVVFSSGEMLPAALRGKTLHTPEATAPAASEQMPGFAEAASIDGRCSWRVSSGPVGTCYIVGTPPPRLGEGRHLSEILNGETFLHALPLWLFLRALAPGPRWEPPPLRACLIVDDPNLHRPSYGRIDYQALVDFARQRPFHAAMAIVPLDGWWVNPTAAKLFRENPGALSLLVHGNDHLHYELAQDLSESGRLALLAQSLARTAALERKSGVPVDRVMAPPHGVCAPGMIGLLWRMGFEGMTTNRWSLWKHSPAATLPANSGFSPADLLGGGLPVIPRFRFKSVIGRNETCLAALFGQPIVPYGHHQDFSNGMADVESAVDAVNALGPVQWMSMRDIVRTNFETLKEGATFRIRLFSRHAQGVMLPDTNRLQAELSPHATGSGTVTVGWNLGSSSGQVAGRLGEPLDVPAGSRFELRLHTPFPAHGTPPSPRLRPKALLLRLASEARDRLCL